MTFSPKVDLQGFRVESQFDIENLECTNLDLPHYQLAILLFPPDQYNEKFLIKIRDCVLRLNTEHPLKKWVTDIGKNNPQKLNSVSINFDQLIDVINSPFNLITDLKFKNDVTKLISEAPEKTIIEKLVRSYLYLMIGNLNQSDAILKTILAMPPREFFRSFSLRKSVYHHQGLIYLTKILEKLGKHPADRLTFILFLEYLKMYTNSADLLSIIDSIGIKAEPKRLDLRYTETIAPDFLAFHKFERLNLKERNNLLKKKKNSLELLTYWVLPFTDFVMPIEDKLQEELKKIQENDFLWYSYLITDERMADFHVKSGGQSIQQRRKKLKELLNDEADFMLTLYLLIQAGDVDHFLVDSVLKFQLND